MKKIQFIGTTPEALFEHFDVSISKRFEEFKKGLNLKEPTEYLTRNEVSEMLKIDLSSVHNWTKKGILQAYQIGGRVYYKLSEIENAIVKLNK